MVKNLKEIWECAVRELSRRKSRTVTNVLFYLIAISILLVILTFLQASRDYSRSILANVGTHFVVYMTAQPSNKTCCISDVPSGEGFFAAGVSAQPFSQNMVEKITSLSGIKDASPYISYRMQDRQDKHFFVIGGFDPSRDVSVNSTVCAPGDLVAGRFLEPEDSGKSVFIAEKNYAVVRNYSVGDTIKILDKDFELVGIVNPSTRPARADIYMHLEIAKKIIVDRIPQDLLRDAAINAVLVEATDALVQDAAIAKIKKLDNRLEIYGFGCYRPAAKAIGVNERTIWFLAMLILTATILFSMKTQLTSVMERQHDIGILKAIGWSNKVVVWQILLESLSQALAGGILGCLTAVLVVTFVPLRLVVGQPVLTGVTIPAFFFLSAVLLSVLGGIIAGIVPALNAARKYPAEALRHI